MHILMIAQSFYEFDARILRQTSALIDAGHTVDIISLKHNRNVDKEIKNGIRVYPIMEKFEQDKVISYVFYSIIFLIKALFKSMRLYYQWKPAIVQIHNMPDYLVFAASFLKVLGVPVILDIHDLTVELFKEKWGPRKFNKLKFFLISSEIVSTKFANKVITVSNECGEKLKARGVPDKKLTIIMNVPDMTYFPFNDAREFNHPDKGINLFYHGTIAERYGLHNTIVALPHLIKDMPNFTFSLVGSFDSEYGKSLKDLVKKLNLDANVIFENSIPYHKVSERIKQADIGIVTESIQEYSHYGIATKIFEYAAVGLPMIINDIPINRSVFRDESAVFVNHSDSEQISLKIIELAKKPEKRMLMTKNAYNDLQEVSYGVMSKRYLQLIQSFNNN